MTLLVPNLPHIFEKSQTEKFAFFHYNYIPPFDIVFNFSSSSSKKWWWKTKPRQRHCASRLPNLCAFCCKMSSSSILKYSHSFCSPFWHFQIILSSLIRAAAYVHSPDQLYSTQLNSGLGIVSVWLLCVCVIIMMIESPRSITEKWVVFSYFSLLLSSLLLCLIGEIINY